MPNPAPPRLTRAQEDALLAMWEGSDEALFDGTWWEVETLPGTVRVAGPDMKALCIQGLAAYRFKAQEAVITDAGRAAAKDIRERREEAT